MKKLWIVIAVLGVILALFTAVQFRQTGSEVSGDRVVEQNFSRPAHRKMPTYEELLKQNQ